MGRLPGARHAVSFEASKSEGLSQIEEVTNMLKVQTDALADLHLKIKNIQDTANKVGEFANKIRGIEVELGEAKKAAEQIVGANTGMGELAKEVATIKAKAAEQQSDLILAKDAVDKLIPTNAGIDCMASLLVVHARFSTHRRRPPREPPRHAAFL
ncbi:hypothetical protein AK812_SmicGene38051 [Symbiodinium microadriaticum]|uniref:Uncharacterized protein n=1 Tax=Symbiodinium microadriaticum TaxID=2951 RepID=A0A1Q9CEQ5_SYMMI|nr:hypothetical protein AK812_SmicGene38051 [Symbiodinium microadriaticum]CAE7273233.1 unnamed protein product [Symbiodinium microadriaticum]